MVLNADGGVSQALRWELQMVHGVWWTPPAHHPLSKSIHGCRVWAPLPGPGVLIIMTSLNIGLVTSRAIESYYYYKRKH